MLVSRQIGRKLSNFSEFILKFVFDSIGPYERIFYLKKYIKKIFEIQNSIIFWLVTQYNKGNYISLTEINIYIYTV